MSSGAPMPPPAPAEKHVLDLVEAQAKRIDIQASEIERRWQEVKGLHAQVRDADRRADESPLKYAQLKLEAYLGLWKVVSVAVAVVIVALLVAALLWFRHKELAELVKAAWAEEPSQTVSVREAGGGSASSAASSLPQGASASASRKVSPGSPR